MSTKKPRIIIIYLTTDFMNPLRESASLWDRKTQSQTQTCALALIMGKMKFLCLLYSIHSVTFWSSCLRASTVTVCFQGTTAILEVVPWEPWTCPGKVLTAEFRAEQMDGWMLSAPPYASPAYLQERGYRLKRCQKKTKKDHILTFKLLWTKREIKKIPQQPVCNFWKRWYKRGKIWMENRSDLLPLPPPYSRVHTPAAVIQLHTHCCGSVETHTHTHTLRSAPIPALETSSQGQELRVRRRRA